jgi:tetratricopeptide (TPR) repeat protein
LTLAEQTARLAIRLNPRLPDAYNAPGGVYARQGRNSEAIENLRKALNMAPNSEWALAMLRRAVQLGNHNYPWFQRDKNYHNLRGDPEYQRIMMDARNHWERYRKAFG